MATKELLGLLALAGAGISLYLSQKDSDEYKNFIKKRNNILKNEKNLDNILAGLKEICKKNASYTDNLKEHAEEINKTLTISELTRYSSIFRNKFSKDILEYFYSDMLMAMAIGLSEAYIKNKWSYFDLRDDLPKFYPKELSILKTRHDIETALFRMKRRKHIKAEYVDLILNLYDIFKKPVLNSGFLEVDINLVENNVNTNSHPFDFNNAKLYLSKVINMILND